MPARSVRARTTLLASVVVGVSLVAAAWLLLVTLEHSLSRAGDDLARSRAADLSSLAEQGRLPRRLADVGDDTVAQVVAPSGRVLASSPSIRGRPPVTDDPPRSGEPVVRTLRGVPDDDETEDYRVWMLTTMTPDGPVHVYVGTSLESVGETVSLLRRTLLAGVPALLALLAFGIWIVIGRALRPVEAIRSEVATISARALDRRVPVPDSHDEVSRLATTMNEMLDRLEDAAGRQRRFVADASHELQSPLAALRSQLEVALADPTRTDWPTTARRLVADEERMERLVRDLLFLARHDESAQPAPSEAVDLDDVVLEEVARLRVTHEREVDTTGVSAAPVRGRRHDLARLVRNLVANALEHATSRVWVEVASTGDAVTLAVRDDGPGVPAADRDRVFDRFYRADAARSPDGSGTGLGLAIARTIAEQHGGRITIADSESGALFVVCLPSLETPAAGAERLVGHRRQPDASGADERCGNRQMWGPSEYESGGPHGRSK